MFAYDIIANPAQLQAYLRQPSEPFEERLSKTVELPVTASEQRDLLEHGLLDIFTHAMQSCCSLSQFDVPVRNHHPSKSTLMDPGLNADSNGGNSENQYFDICIWDISVSYDLFVKSQALMDTERLAELSRRTPSRVQRVSLDSVVMQLSRTYPGTSDVVQKGISACAQVDDNRQEITTVEHNEACEAGQISYRDVIQEKVV